MSIAWGVEGIEAANNAKIKRLSDRIAALEAEVERLKEENEFYKSWWDTCSKRPISVIKEIRGEAKAAGKREAAEWCKEIVDDVVSDHRWGNDGSCGVNTAIKAAITAKYLTKEV